MLTAFLALFVVQIIWGFTFPMVQDSLEFASPLVFVALRFAIAAIVFAGIFWKQFASLHPLFNSPLGQGGRNVLKKGAVLGVLLAGGYVLQTYGLAHTTSARSGFFTGLYVPLAPVFAWLLFRAHIQLRQWLAVGLATVGIFVMSQPGAGGLNIGDIATIGCAICFALQIVYVARWVNRSNEAPLTWLQLSATALLATLMIPAETPKLVLEPYLIFAVLFTAIVASALAIWIQSRFQPKLSLTIAALIYSTEPIFAALAAYLMQNHIPPMTTLYGAVFILAGMTISSTTRQKEFDSA